MAGAAMLKDLLKVELEQLSEEGRQIDTEFWSKKIDECNNDKAKLMEVYSSLCKLPMREDYPYSEPTELADIESESEIALLPDDKYISVDRKYFRGAWLGRCIGCAIGQPVEAWKSADIVAWYKNAGKYPIQSFVPTVSGENRNEGLATDEKICGMPLDDDIRFTVINYLLIKSKGYDIDSWDIAQHWTQILPFRFVFTAESQAYLNFINLDQCLHWYKPENAVDMLRDEKVNTYLNPYREYIGAQIRCDAFAYLSAGMPKRASRLAHTDAYFTHVKNGIYGEMFFAAFIAAAFTEKDVDKCFKTAIAVVPKNSRFYKAALTAKELTETCETREALMEQVLNIVDKYNWVHTINNAVICLAAIFRYKNDFRNAVAFAVECGADTDCNGATVGSFMGALLGESGIPADLANIINDTFSVGVAPYDNYSIRRFADEVKELCDQLNK